VASLMQGGGVIAFLVFEGFKGRKLYHIAGG
jgi:hypothetical protein